MVQREPGDTGYVGEDWHADTTMVAEPPMGAILYAIEVPPYGGDTLFASQYAAYDALSDGMKRLLSGLKALHSDRKVAGPRVGQLLNQDRATKVRADDAWRETVSAHPVVVTHPETGRKLLYVNHSYTVGFEGMTEAESRPLLDYLLEWGHRPEFTCRFRWAPGSIAFWDNRVCKHLAVHDAGHFRRMMRRVQLAVKLEVTFTGKLSKEEWISLSSAYDIFINTTHFDNTPVSVIEAMALGMPIISTNVGGIPFLLQHLKNALLVSDGDVPSMANEIINLIKNPKLALQLSENGRKTVENFDWEIVKKQWFELLN